MKRIKSVVKDCGHKAEARYWWKLDKIILRLCPECNDKLFNKMFEQFVLENRVQEQVNIMVQNDIEKLYEEINKLKEKKK